MKRVPRKPTQLRIMIDQRQSGKVENFSYLSSVIINAARRTHDTEARIIMTKAAFKKKTVFMS